MLETHILSLRIKLVFFLKRCILMWSIYRLHSRNRLIISPYILTWAKLLSDLQVLLRNNTIYTRQTLFDIVSVTWGNAWGILSIITTCMCVWKEQVGSFTTYLHIFRVARLTHQIILRNFRSPICPTFYLTGHRNVKKTTSVLATPPVILLAFHSSRLF